MTEEAKRLYALLEEADEAGRPDVGLEEICDRLGIPYTAALHQYPSNSKEYRLVWNLIEEINNSLEKDKCVFRARNYRYRLATEAELKSYCLRLHQQASDLHDRAKIIEAKIGQDGQGKTTTNDCTEMVDCEPAFHEAFARGTA